MEPTFKDEMDGLRGEIAGLVEKAVGIKNKVQNGEVANISNTGETIANITLAYRALEDAAMRFGKAIQAAGDGVSPLGGPATPKP